ncbi:MAG: phosphoribosylaminoimidazole carboxylase, ATPase subunit [Actinomycetia bacterium]|nr:phosphoribosylaminoimidazole carboxylase, ATPase subunit [Actinomycetes bacterium]
MDTPVSPTVACIGGGQLGRMLGLAALPLGIRMEFVDPVVGAPAGEIGPLHIGELDERGVIRPLLERATVVTYEWEGVPADIVSWIEEQRRPPVYPPAAALRASQDRLYEKTLFRQLDVGTPDFLPVDSFADLEDAVAVLGAPAVLKTRRGGYDGKGQHVLRVPADAPVAWAALGGVPLILEAFVPFDRELSVLAVRGRDGSTECWPVVENHHSEGMLRRSNAPAPGLTPELQAAAVAIATRMLDELLYVGVLAIELFDVGGRLLANEMAPRVHNSGHWTIEGAVTSQFENHVRAILGWPLGSTETRGVSTMLNCIGVMPAPADILAVPGAHLHDYGKTPRHARKLGHVTVVADDADTLHDRVDRVLAVLPADG